MKLLFRKWWFYLAVLLTGYLIAFPFYFRDPEATIFFEVYSRFNGTLEHMAIDENKEQLVANNDSITIGSQAPDFILTSLQGDEVSLSDFNGKTVLLTFWASWCPTCRGENKHLAEIYPEYKDEGFEILGVSLDRSRTNWEKAVEKDGIAWPQVSDLEGVDSPVATLYGVYSTPTTFLIDSAGVVIAKNALTEELEDYLR
ncbi:MAG: TlpA family protein disulfide reductase [Balneolaceae bacterium]|nr:TlpA family protein disulfide reductase [Balneolaceae bacterium]MBO6545328.1 TlpA family protein disulfide reductase [Balneolaceae bacterium]MBO6646724.1 TlpA family protein disulfide reductase [Balneolaceae bacterium]